MSKCAHEHCRGDAYQPKESWHRSGSLSDQIRRLSDSPASRRRYDSAPAQSSNRELMLEASLFRAARPPPSFREILSNASSLGGSLWGAPVWAKTLVSTSGPWFDSEPNSITQCIDWQIL